MDLCLRIQTIMYQLVISLIGPFQGKLKPKKIQALLSSLQPADRFLGIGLSEKKLVGVKVLREQEEAIQDGQVLVGVVSMCFSPPEGVPVLVERSRLFLTCSFPHLHFSSPALFLHDHSSLQWVCAGGC